MLDRTPPPHIQALVDQFIEVRLAKPDDFLKVKETLQRIGIASRKEKKLFQSCHIFHKRGRYYIVHYKELFLLDRKVQQTRFDENDRARRNTIANMLAEWDLVELVDPSKSAEPVVSTSQITVLTHRERAQWQFVAKYEIGKVRK